MKMQVRQGITFLETMVVISLIGLLLSLILPAVQQVRAAAETMSCKNNMRNIGVAMHHCLAASGRFVPPFGKGPPLTNTPESLLSWMVGLLPYLEKDGVYLEAVMACQQSTYVFGNHHLKGMETIVPIYICPSDPRLLSLLELMPGQKVATTSYIGINSVSFRGRNVADYGVFALRVPSPNNIPDGLSNTIAVSERPPPDVNPSAGWWYPVFYFGGECFGPNTIISLRSSGLDCNKCIPETTCLSPGRLDNPCDRFHLWSLHPRGANFLFADASVRFLKYSGDAIIPSLATVRGGEAVSLDD